MGTVSTESKAQFERNFIAVFASLTSHARAKLRHVQDAEDLVSRAALKAWRAWPTYQDEGNFSAWMHRILANEIVSFYRQNACRIPAGYDPEGAAQMTCDGEQEARHHVRDTLRAIDGLAPGMRTALVRNAIGGESDSEIAADLKCAVKTVRANVHRARKHLRRAAAV